MDHDRVVPSRRTWIETPDKPEEKTRAQKLGRLRARLRELRNVDHISGELGSFLHGVLDYLSDEAS